MPIIQGELGDLTPEEAEAREQGVKSVKEKLSEEQPGVQTIVIDIGGGPVERGEKEPEKPGS